VLISAQVALSLVLLIGAALLVRSLRSVETVETGLDRDRLLIVDVDPMSRSYEGERLRLMAREVSERLGRIPGVAAVTYSENGIFSGTESGATLQVPGFTARTDEDTVAAYDNVGPGYVRAIGGRLVAGRDFTASDGMGAALVALVNQTMARFYFGAANPLGRVLRLDDSTSVQIVGVVADVKDHELRGEVARRFYLPMQQSRFTGGGLSFIVRATGDPGLLATPVRGAITAFDPLLHIDEVNPLSTLMRNSVSGERLLARIATGFGVLALVLAAVGLYGVMTYAIARRTSEIGLRVALGARRANVVGMVLGDALKLVGAGVAIGVPLALAATRLLRNQLFGVAATDPASIAAALAVLVASGAVAAVIPAVRASRVAPQIALRQE
jgi:predicted permease